MRIIHQIAVFRLGLFSVIWSPARLCAAFAVIALMFMPTSATAVVVIFDGFGDGDVNNNGIALEAVDTDVSGAGQGTPGDAYIPVPVDDPNGNEINSIFPAGTMVQEVTSVTDAGDVGLPWYQARGFTPSGQDKPNIRILDDSAGYLPETDPNIGFEYVFGGTRFSAAIDSGPALAIEQKGRGSAFTAFFDDDYSDGNQGRIELGPEVGDKVKVSLDFRVWMSAPNNNFSNAPGHIPRFGDIRIGLFQDTDGELGMTNPNAGLDPNTLALEPAVWGSEGGQFRGDAPFTPGPGAAGDHGWYTKFEVGDPEGIFLEIISPNGSAARLNEETNELPGAKFIEGSDTDSVIVADPNTAPFVNLDYKKVYNLALILERFDDPNTPGTAGDAILGTIEVFDYATSTLYTLSGFDGVNEITANDPNGGFSSDSWDYFGMKADGSSDEFDYLIDNFMVEIFGSNEPNSADFDGNGVVDGLDFLRWQRGNTPGGGSPAELALWEAQYGTSPLAAAVAAVPEPSSALLLGLGIVMVLRTKRRSKKD